MEGRTAELCLSNPFRVAPGTGKSTLAAGVFNRLKRRGINCELVQEYAKSRVWETQTEGLLSAQRSWASLFTLDDQIYVFGKQSHKQFVCREQVDVIITDSPILLCLYYGRNLPANVYEHFKGLVLEVFNEYENLNYMLLRGDIKYEETGRLQKEGEAREVEKEISELLRREHVNRYYMVSGEKEYEENENLIIKDVIERLK